MKSALAAVAAASALIAAPAMAQSQMSAADTADMECLAVFALIGDSDPEMQTVAGMGIMFYLGRLEGRTPGVDHLRRFADWVVAVPEQKLADQLDAASPRCAQEIGARGDRLVEIGDELARYGT